MGIARVPRGEMCIMEGCMCGKERMCGEWCMCGEEMYGEEYMCGEVGRG
jgi:hypothetical protein